MEAKKNDTQESNHGFFKTNRTLIIMSVIIAFALVVGIATVVPLAVQNNNNQVTQQTTIKTSTQSRTTFSTINPTTTTKPANLLKKSDCGVQKNPPFTNRIINGKNAIANSWPWIVSLRIKLDDGSLGPHFCAGTLIDSLFILTAAHCLKNINPSKLVLIIGVSDFNSLNTVLDVFLISAFYSHEEFNSDTFANDIALIKLLNPVASSDKISFSCLPTNGSYVSNGGFAIAAGWGSSNGINYSPDFPQQLQQTTLKIMNGQTVCSRVAYDQTKFFCMLDSDTNIASNICMGDSGGPLMFNF